MAVEVERHARRGMPNICWTTFTLPPAAIVSGPGGIAVAAGGPDRDGLEMDILHLRLGPVLADWPAGLVLWCSLQGDAIAGVDVDTTDVFAAPQRSAAMTAYRIDAAARLLSLAGAAAGAACRLAPSSRPSAACGSWLGCRSRSSSCAWGWSAPRSGGRSARPPASTSPEGCSPSSPSRPAAGAGGPVSAVGCRVALNAAVFLGGGAGPLLPSPVWMTLKTVARLAVLVAVRRWLPLLRPERVMELGWMVLLPASLLQVLSSPSSPWRGAEVVIMLSLAGVLALASGALVFVVDSMARAICARRLADRRVGIRLDR